MIVGRQGARASKAGSANGKRLLGVGAAVLLVVSMIAERASVLAQAPPTDFDDAYTYLRYARHWLAGEGLAWNPGQGPVYGATSLLHLALVTLVRWARPAWPLWRVLQLASGAAALALLAALAATVALASQPGRRSGSVAACAVAVVALVPFHDAFVFHAATGMDTMLSALANTAVIFATLALAAKPSRARIGLAVVAASLAVLARPDNLICASLCPTLALAIVARKPRLALVYAVLGGAVWVGLGLSAWWLLGAPVPLSCLAKQPGYYVGFAGELGWNPFRFLEVFFRSAWPFVAALVLFGDRISLRQAAVLVGPALVTIATLFRFRQIMGHLGRFYYPLLPFFVVAGTLAFARWLASKGWQGRAKGLVLRSLLSALVVWAIHAGLGLGGERFDARAAAESPASTAGYRVAAARPLPDLDSWHAARQVAAMAAAAPRGARFAMSEHGLPGAVAPQIEIVDVLGLHDPWFARHGFSAAELFRRRPEVIWFPHADHVGMVAQILADDDLWAHYDVYPEAFFHGLALRRDGPHAAELAALLAQAWQASYPGFAMADYSARRAP